MLSLQVSEGRVLTGTPRATWHRFILQTIAIEEQALQAAAALLAAILAAIPGSAPALQSML